MINLANLLGKTEAEARQICENYGYTLRVIVVDGNSLFVTADMRGNRVNVHMNNGLVSVVGGVG